VTRSLAIIIVSTMVLMLAMFLLMLTESQSFDKIMFETISAFATVGLSTGITASLSEPGKLILVLVMICGRLGPSPWPSCWPAGGDPHPLSGRERLHG
jgi:trk system potassium uptake protein TrkH